MPKAWHLQSGIEWMWSCVGKGDTSVAGRPSLGCIHVFSHVIARLERLEPLPKQGGQLMIRLVSSCCKSLSAACASISWHRFVATTTLLLSIALWIFPQASNARGVCDLLNEVVESATETTPFRSVRYLSAPNGKCQVADQERHEDMGAYVPAYSIVRNGEDRHVDSWLCFWRDDMISQLWDQYWSIDDQLDEMSRSDPGYRELRQQRRSIERAIGEAADAMHSQARELLYSIQQCIREGSIWGSWREGYEDVEYESDGYFDRGQWVMYQEPNDAVRIKVRAMSYKSRRVGYTSTPQISLQVFRH